MDTHERLTIARKKAGFETATQAAEAVGVPYPTYAGHENGSSGFRADKGALYARRFKVRFEWLMRGVGPMVDRATKYQDVSVVYDCPPPDLKKSYDDEWRMRLAAAIEVSQRSPRAISLAAGLGPGYIHSILKEGKDPTITSLLKVGRELNISLSHLMFGYDFSAIDEELITVLANSSEDRKAAIVALLR